MTVSISSISTVQTPTRQDFRDVLEPWCHSLRALQVREIRSPGLFGGILCPACSRIHGRSGDAIYPLLHMARHTGDEGYVQAAIDLFAWTDHVSRPDGSWANETIGYPWLGITVFGAIALGESLRHYGDLLPGPVRRAWTHRLRRAAGFIFDTFTLQTGNINYPASAPAALALAGLLVDEPRFLVRAAELARECLACFTKPNLLLWGEGPRVPSPRGLRAVDLGYNVEESLPNLALYATLAGDEALLEFVTLSFRHHLEFLLPDGAWDNSWGTRNYKWTYWGSRTSDGCQGGLMLLAGRDPLFAVAALRNLRLLKACTQGGLLHGGPHAHDHGEPVCIHHTLFHAKSLTAALDSGHFEERPSEWADARQTAPIVLLPRDKPGVREFPEIATWLVSHGPWRGTITNNDVRYAKLRQGHATGGALTLLWHEQAGLVLCASMTRYSLEEASNMPVVRLPNDAETLTPRLVLRRASGEFTNLNDVNAEVSWWASETGQGITFESRGRLADAGGSGPEAGEVGFVTRYVFGEASFRLEVEVTGQGDLDSLEYVCPMVSRFDAPLEPDGTLAIPLARPNAVVRIKANRPASVASIDDARGYNHVPGLEADIWRFPFRAGETEPLIISISVESTGRFP